MCSADYDAHDGKPPAVSAVMRCSVRTFEHATFTAETVESLLVTAGVQVGNDYRITIEAA